MERYRTLQSSARPYISLPPQTHLKETPIPSHLLLENPANRLGRRADDTEISIFDADRYFNGPNPTRRTLILEAIAGRRHLESSSATPTAPSEASWNSQSGLLTNPPGSALIKIGSFPPPKSARRRFRRKCPCTDEKSVDVEENYSERKTPIRSKSNLDVPKPRPESSPIIPTQSHLDPIEEVRRLKLLAGNWVKSPVDSGRFSPDIGRRIVNSGFGFSFPVLNPTHIEDLPRDSIDVFQPAEEPEIDRRCSGDRRSFNSRPIDDDAMSDASSDLFEIESFSTQVTSRRLDSLDDGFDQRRLSGVMEFRRSFEAASGAAPSIAASECYPPSEASVEWSVTTAEGFDRSSLANFSSASSEYEDFRFVPPDTGRFAAGERRRSVGGLLSCVSEKAVSVGPPVRSGPTGFRGWRG